MVKCSFSGKEIAPGKGLMYVKSDGKILYFAGRKEEKNWKMRKAQNVAWTAEYRKAKKERMAAAKHEKKKDTSVKKETSKSQTKKSASKKN